ncbi:MAG TPA: PRC-barrel domain-containing protein, partial [Ardenticatenaceae bacterium]|nr:PRC-barrel domain-containing protein [Ardenticatenaceae bacterium]
RVLPWPAVHAIGPDAVVATTKSAVVPADEVPELQAILARDNVLKGTTIMTTDGRSLGSLVDIHFDEQSGAIVGYEVSRGLLADATGGRSFVPAAATLKIGKDMAFVPPEVADRISEPSGGIQAALQAAGEKLQETTQAASEKLQELSRSQTAATPLATGSPHERKGFGPGGSKEGEARRTQEALGRPVTRAIVDQNDRIILDRGELVTNLALQRAREAGVLDVLLDSVYWAD